MKSYNPYPHPSDFFFASKLSDERKAEIISWVKSLDERELDMLNDIIDDKRADGDYYANL